MSRPWMLMFLLFPVLVAGCGEPEFEPDPVTEEPDQVPFNEHVLESKRTWENNARLAAGHTIHWEWTVEEGVPIGFDVHRHVGEETDYPYQVEAAEDTGSYRVPAADDYSVMWYNNSTQAVTLSYRTWIEE